MINKIEFGESITFAEYMYGLIELLNHYRYYRCRDGYMYFYGEDKMLAEKLELLFPCRELRDYIEKYSA